MPESIQPITDAVRRGDKSKAIELIKQALSIDPHDVEVLLILASLVEEPTRKRQVLNRILSVTPTHKAAREMLLEMDRAEMGAYRPKPAPAPAPTPQSSGLDRSSKPALDPTPAPQRAVPVSSQATTSAPTSQKDKERPLVFKYSLVTRVVTYIFLALFGCMSLIALQDVTAALLPCSLFLLLLPVIWIISVQVEVSPKRIRTSRLFGLFTAQIGWDEIASLKSNSMQKKLDLISGKGNSVSVSTQVKGYPAVIEILRQKRPDLFGEASLSPAQGMERLQPTTQLDSPAFTGSKTFKKSFIKQYGLLFALIPMCLLFVWLGFADADTRTAFFVTAGFCALLMLIPFFQVNGLVVEPDKLTVQSFFEEKEFSAAQIKEIKMQSLHGRYGRVTNFVNIIPTEGKKYPVSGFSEGEEIIYGFLMNWWNRYQNT